ncbi:hypothetical protein MIND_00723000 [Mycena indigotica]|uniref:Uncharacterized protein n=1 Tax=Mycena indigotica TaxID=2126181 RepID=A0A8H6SMI0_9AGAR|nr:uncharacterized protein MIND_00723000 [Mycena indigotica]KAF7301575.1 hypothetical protein MIND_00723000 [Mycena indigotica]
MFRAEIVELTPEELEELGYLSDNVAPNIKATVEKVLANPKYLSVVTVFMIEVAIRQNTKANSPHGAARFSPPPSPTSPSSPTSTVSDVDTLFSQYSTAPTIVTPDSTRGLRRDRRRLGPCFKWGHLTRSRR